MSGLILELQSVTRRFGGLVAVNSLSLTIARGSIHGLIGPNGAGKSTVFDLISGLQRVSSGRVMFADEDITKLSVAERVERGICRTFQTPKLFEQMTALDVVKTGRHLYGKTGVIGSVLSFRRKRRDEAEIEAYAYGLLERVGVASEAGQLVANLSYGKRRLVEIARALATEPKLLLLDEIASGLNPTETSALSELIREFRQAGLTVVLVEHDMPFVMQLCDSITVLNYGASIASGSGADISSDAGVIEAYLGRSRDVTVTRGEARRAARSSTT